MKDCDINMVKNTKLIVIKRRSLTEKVDLRCVLTQLGRREADLHVHWDEVHGAKMHYRLIAYGHKIIHNKAWYSGTPILPYRWGLCYVSDDYIV